MRIFMCAILAFSISFLVYSIWLMVRYEIAYRNHHKILDAVYRYAITQPDAHKAFIRITNAMESVERTAGRWLDFGCKNILPRVYYELIEPYID